MDNKTKIINIIQLFANFSGNKNVLPEGTEPEDTYQWRYASKFLSLMEEMQVDWDTIRNIIYYSVKYIKNHGNLWSRGLWALTRKDLIEIAYKQSQEDNKQLKNELANLKNNYEFIKSANFDLINSVNGGYPNIVKWYDNKSISITYLSLSESCRKAIEKLDEFDRQALPDNNEILKIRLNVLMNKEIKNKIKLIMKNDFIKITG